MTLSICKPPISLLVTLHFMHSMNHLNGLGGVQNLLKSYFAQIYASISRSPNCSWGIPFAQTKLLSLVFPYCLIKIIRKRLFRAHLLLVLVSSPLLKDNESGQKMCLDNILFIKSHLYNLILIQLSHIIMIRTLFESFQAMVPLHKLMSNKLRRAFYFLVGLMHIRYMFFLCGIPFQSFFILKG